MCDCMEYDDGSRYLCPVCSDMVEDALMKLQESLVLADQQAGNVLLWLPPTTKLQPTKDLQDQLLLLQSELRQLHKTLEGNDGNLQGLPF